MNKFIVVWVLIIGSLSGNAYASFEEHSGSYETVESDPWESFNRVMFGFNDTLDTYILRPIAVGYTTVTPEILDNGISNVFGNLNDVVSIGNSVLQAKLGQSIEMTTRVIFNSTFGVLGFFDVSTSWGLAKKREDFGQTLAVWGVGAGPYLVLPILGPATVRDSVRFVVDPYMDPLTYITDGDREYYTAKAVWLVDARAALIPSENLIVGDKYTFIRNAYLQHREFLNNDGVIDDPFSGDDFDDFDGY